MTDSLVSTVRGVVEPLASILGRFSWCAASGATRAPREAGCGPSSGPPAPLNSCTPSLEQESGDVTIRREEYTNSVDDVQMAQLTYKCFLLEKLSYICSFRSKNQKKNLSDFALFQRV